MRLRHLIVLWSAAAMSAAAAAPRSTPRGSILAPRWQRSLRIGTGGPGSREHAAALRLSPRLVLVFGHSGNSLVALDRPTGRELWRRLAPDSAAGGDHGWRLEGFGGAGSTEVVVFSATYFAAGPRAGPGDDRWTTNLRLTGVHSGSGREVWREDMRPGHYSTDNVATGGVVGGLLTLVQPLPVARLEFRSATSGVPVYPGSPAGRAELRRVASRRGSPWWVFGAPTPALQGDFQGFVANLQGGFARVPTSMSGLGHLPPTGWVEPPVVVGDRIVAKIDTDDGGVGHSAYPKYLVCTDLTGRKLWQYPRRFARHRDPYELGSPTPSVTSACVQRSAGVVAALSDRWRGIRVRDGAVLWSLPRRLSLDAVVPYARGFLAISPGPAAKGAGPTWCSLAYIRGATGAVCRLGRVPWATAMELDGRELYLLSPRTVYAYRLRSGPLRHPSGRR